MLRRSRPFSRALRRGDTVSQLEAAVRQSQTRTFCPYLAMVELGVAAMELARVDRHAPLAKADLAPSTCRS